MSFPRYQHRARVSSADLRATGLSAEHPSAGASSTLAVPERARSRSFCSVSQRPNDDERMRRPSPAAPGRHSLAVNEQDYPTRRHSSARLDEQYGDPYGYYGRHSPLTGYASNEYGQDECRNEPRRRLPPTPAELAQQRRRSSSPRQLPEQPRSLPPPSPTDLRPESPQRPVERRGSGRRLPRPPPSIVSEQPSPVSVSTASFDEPPVSLPRPPMQTPPLASQRRSVCNGFNQTASSYSQASNLREIEPIAWPPRKRSFEHSYDQSFGTPSTNPESQLSSLSPSIEQLTSKSSSDAEDPVALGLNPDLYRENSVSSSSVPDFSGSVCVTGSSSWPESSEKGSSGLGLLHFSAQYFSVRKRLRVSIMKAEGLAGQLRPELELHAFVKVCLMPGKLQKQRSRIVKRTRDAAFNEEFFFDNVDGDYIRMKAINIRVCHHTGKQFQKDVVIGEIDVPLKNVPDLLSKKEIRILEELKPKINTKKLGRLQVTTCLELEARRLTVNIIKADDLPKYGISGPPDPCVKISVDQAGRIQTKQSRVLKNTCNAVYKEAIMFLVSTRQQDLHQTKVTLAVHDTARTAAGSDIIGVAYLGLAAVDRSELEQWRSVTENPGKEYKATHALKLPKDQVPQVRVDDVDSDND